MINWFGRSKPEHPLADTRKVNELIARLPTHDGVQALEEMANWLGTMSQATDLQMDPRFRNLDLLDAASSKHENAVMQEYLGSDGHTVETAPDGKAALQVFQSGGFDLVITDRAMPEMNGDQLAEKIKEISPKTPIIMLTGFGEVMKAKGEHPAGVDRLLSKPITIDGCRDVLAQIFSELAA